MKRSPLELKQIRLQLGWTGSQMASRLGCSVERVLAFESGSKRPDSEAASQYESIFSILVTQSLQNQIRPLADSVLDQENLQQISQDEVSGYAFEKD